MENLLQEYKDYYKVRAERYANNPNYKHSYEAEKNLSNTIQNCNSLDEFKDRIGNLNDLCAFALYKDKYIMENKFLNEFEEKVRVKASERILEEVDNFKDLNESMNFVVNTEKENNNKIILDEANHIFIDNWDQLDKIDIYLNAEVPDEYKQEFKEFAQEIKKNIYEEYLSLKESLADYDKNWEANLDTIMEIRHKRLLSYYKDEFILEKIKQFKAIINL